MFKKLSLAILIATSTAGSAAALEVPRTTFNDMVKSEISDPSMSVYRAELAASLGDYDTAAMNYIAAMKTGFLEITGNLIDLISRKQLSADISLLSVKEIERLSSDNRQLSLYLGSFYEESSLNQNLRHSFFWYHNAMRLGDQDVVRKIADFVMAKKGGADEVYTSVDALSMYRSYVDRHQTPDIAFDIAESLYSGTKISRNLKLAYKYYMMAADGGVTPAFFRLAYMSEKGIGANVDLEKAVDFYHKSLTTKDSTEALYRLGRIHMYSEGAMGQPVKGYSFLKKAADAGHLDAMYKVALMHFYGTDFANVDTKMAIDYFDRASLAGSEMATLKLIDIYTNGASGIQPSRSKVMELKKRQLD